MSTDPSDQNRPSSQKRLELPSGPRQAVQEHPVSEEAALHPILEHPQAPSDGLFSGNAAPWQSPVNAEIEPVEGVASRNGSSRPKPERLENLKAVLFDMGDTLLDFGPLNNRAVFDESARESYDFLVKSGHRVPTFEEYHRKKYWAVRKALIWAKIRRWEFNSSRLLRRLCDKLNLPADDAFVMELAWSSFSPLVGKASLENDLIQTLKDIRASGLKMAIVSNTFISGKVHDKHLELVGLLEFFPVRIYSSEVGHRKPSREIFRRALEQVGAAADDSIFIGDLEKIDVYGARRAGMYTVLKRPADDGTRPHSADYLIRRISDLRPILPLKQA